MRWSDPLDVYCERTDPSLWSEPLNVVTNLAFLAAAALLWRQAGRGAGRDMRLLTLLIGVAIGGQLLGIVPEVVLLPVLVAILLVSSVKVWRHG